MPNNNRPNTKILLPKVDVIFKLLFGDQRNVDILKGFLKSVLTIPEEEYESITIIDPHLKREDIDDKLSIVDVKVNTKSGNIINVEMQVLEQTGMAERVTYGNAKSFVSQLKLGEPFYNLQKTISIVIADFEMIHGSLAYHHVFKLYDETNRIQFTDKMEINVLELNKVPLTTDNTKKYQWVQFLRAEKEEEFQMIAEKNPTIEKAYVELKRLSQDEEAELIYEARQRAIRDDLGRLHFAEQKGLQQGEQKEKIAIAQKLFKLNQSLDMIMEATELPLEVLKKELNIE